MTATISPAKNTRTVPPPEGRDRAGKPLKTAAQYVIWMALFLLTVEGVLAFAGLGEEEIFALDRELGTRHMTDKSVTWRKEGYARSYLDGEGLREGHIAKAKAPGTFRIALMGDSLVEGLQVPVEETFGRDLQSRLSADLGRPVQVINFATSGYSTAQEYLQLQKQVLDWAPDLVIVGYNARDMFENWAAPDNTIANVRPLALKLPGKDLVVDSSSISQWMRTPRARFLLAISWLRQHSRIWGLVSAFETEASFHNETYKTMMALLNQPAKTSKALIKDLFDQAKWRSAISKAQNDAGQYWTSLFSAAPSQAVAMTAPVTATQSKSTFGAPVKKAISTASATINAEAHGPNGYVTMMSNTLEALYQGMEARLASKGAHLMVLAMPSRAAILPISGMDEAVYGTDYQGEVQILHDICARNHILYVDALHPAMTFDNESQQRLFYTAHMTKEGHQYLADTIYAPVKTYIDNASSPAGK